MTVHVPAPSADRTLEPSTKPRPPGRDFIYPPSEASSLLITEVHWLTAILCRPEHDSRGLSPSSQAKIQGYLQAEIMGRCSFLKRRDLSPGRHPGRSCWRTIPGSGRGGVVHASAACLQRGDSEAPPAGMTGSWGDLRRAEKRTPRRAEIWEISVEFEPHDGELGDSESRWNVCRQNHVVRAPSFLWSRNVCLRRCT